MNEMSLPPKKEKNLITFTSLCWGSVYAFWILENLAPHTTVSQIGLAIMVLLLSGYCVFHGQIRLTPILCAYAGLILVQLCYWGFGFTLRSSVTLKDLQTMAICLVCAVLIYTFFSLNGSQEKVRLFFIYTGLVSLLTVMFLCRNTILTGRMAHAYGKDSVSYYFFGKPIAISSNGIATYSCIGAFFTLTNYSKEKKRKWLLYGAVFLIGVVLTGSRKGILMCGAVWVIYELVIKQKGSLVLKGLIALLAIVAGYFLVTSIPVLRRIIGARLEALVLNTLTGANLLEGSMSARIRYASYAVENIRKNFLVGNGLGWFKSVYGNVTENNYYELLVGCGLLGLLVNYSFVPNAVIKVYQYRNDEMCLATGLLLLFLVVMQWGSVVYMSRDILIYESLFYLAIRCWKTDRKERIGNKAHRNNG